MNNRENNRQGAQHQRSVQNSRQQHSVHDPRQLRQSQQVYNSRKPCPQNQQRQVSDPRQQRQVHESQQFRQPQQVRDPLQLRSSRQVGDTRQSQQSRDPNQRRSARQSHDPRQFQQVRVPRQRCSAHDPRQPQYRNRPVRATSTNPSNTNPSSRNQPDVNPYSRNSWQASEHRRTASSAKEQRNISALVIVALVLLVLLLFITVFFGFCSNRSATNSANTATTSTDAAFTGDDLSQQSQAVNTPEAEAAITLTLSGCSDTYVLAGETYVEPGAHAVENKSTDISKSITVEGDVNTSSPGDYSVIYTATSTQGLKVQRTRTVHVVQTMDKNTAGVPVLMYHYVHTAQDAPETEDANSILDTKLEEQLQWLTSNGYYYPSYAELRAYIDSTHSLPKNSVVLTFDDGSPNFLQYGVPLLEKYKVPATSFIVGVDNIEPCTANASPYVTFQSHSYDMHRAGGTKGHGGRISALTQAEVLDDLQKNITLLGSADALAYPYGDTTEEAQAAVKQAGIKCAFTTNYGKVHVGDDFTNLDRVRVQGGATLSSYIASIEE